MFSGIFFLLTGNTSNSVIFFTSNSKTALFADFNLFLRLINCFAPKQRLMAIFFSFFIWFSRFSCNSFADFIVFVYKYGMFQRFIVNTNTSDTNPCSTNNFQGTSTKINAMVEVGLINKSKLYFRSEIKHIANNSRCQS